LCAGFYSKDSILEAVKASKVWGADIAYVAVVIGVFVTAFYSFRMYFMVFHGKERYDEMPHDDHAHGDEHHGLGHGEKPHESPWVVWVPLVLLAIPSVVIGAIAIEPMLFGTFFQDVIYVAPEHYSLGHIREILTTWWGMALHGFMTLPFWLAASGVALAWFFYLKRPDIPAAIQQRFSGVHKLLENKYYLDIFNEWAFAGGARKLGGALWKFGDVTIIDGIMVNGTARVIGWFSGVSRYIQSGFLYTYAFWMILGVFILLTMVYFRIH
jgi:NADH-quinone oxidoreductase subunit L